MNATFFPHPGGHEEHEGKIFFPNFMTFVSFVVNHQIPNFAPLVSLRRRSGHALRELFQTQAANCLRKNSMERAHDWRSDSAT